MEEPVKPKSSCSGGRRKMKSRMTAGRRRRTMKGGMGYGFGGTIGTAGPEWNPSWGGEVTKSGQPVLDGGRRRKSKKGSKKSHRRRTMKGGGSVAGVGYGFDGSGARGMANAVGYPSNLPTKDFPIPK